MTIFSVSECHCSADCGPDIGRSLHPSGRTDSVFSVTALYVVGIGVDVMKMRTDIVVGGAELWGPVLLHDWSRFAPLEATAQRDEDEHGQDGDVQPEQDTQPQDHWTVRRISLTHLLSTGS